ncbi:GerAB/ArcD/ProY family transporter [Clostridium sp. 19966]|uniref:GerAB/ArcD/ProY family transporter n=1 Tax=Clostridium sp. 19966 TaxID=2768166 RepID=UPI0028DF301D|nr:GerAB/ArcD/ProY family transporter [Clostridium sp. 19966]MDT8716807.1 GerAB/ArcD/ProY family transporter [Clostridium sp. 19966]
MVRISSHQLFTLALAFEIGSTTIFVLGIEAKQDAWLVIILATLIGIASTWIYTKLQNNFPNNNYSEIIIKILGSKLGTPLAVLYCCEWFWHSARNLREFGELIIITTLPNTSLILICSLISLVSAYTLTKGIESLARASEILLPIIVIFLITSYILIFISKNADLKNITPFFAGGLKPIIKAVPEVVMFPFGESLVFNMYFNLANRKEKVSKTMLLVILLSGIILCCSTIVIILSLGAKYASIATIPLVEAIRLVNIGDIITNIDAVGVTIIFLGGFFKICTYAGGTIMGINTIFNIKNRKVTVVVFHLILLVFSIKFEPSYAYHKWMFPFDINNFAIYYSNLFPLLLIGILWIKKRRAKQG